MLTSRHKGKRVVRLDGQLRTVWATGLGTGLSAHLKWDPTDRRLASDSAAKSNWLISAPSQAWIRVGCLFVISQTSISQCPHEWRNEASISGVLSVPNAKHH